MKPLQFARSLSQWTGFAQKVTQDDIKIRFHLCHMRLNKTLYKNLSEERRQMAAYPFHPALKVTACLYQGRILDRIILGMVRKGGFNGNVAFDPFCFQNFGWTSTKQIVIGEALHETLQLNHDDSRRDLAGYFFFLQASKADVKQT